MNLNELYTYKDDPIVGDMVQNYLDDDIKYIDTTPNKYIPTVVDVYDHLKWLYPNIDFIDSDTESFTFHLYAPTEEEYDISEEVPMEDVESYPIFLKATVHPDYTDFTVTTGRTWNIVANGDTIIAQNNYEEGWYDYKMDNKELIRVLEDFRYKKDDTPFYIEYFELNGHCY